MLLQDWIRQRCRSPEGYTITRFARDVGCSRPRAYALIKGRAELDSKITEAIERVTAGRVTAGDLRAAQARREQRTP